VAVILVIRSVLAQSERKHFYAAAGTRLFDWMEEHAAHMPPTCRVYVNGALREDDIVLGAQDNVLIAGSPAIAAVAGASIWQIVISTAISMAVNMLVAQIFGGKGSTPQNLSVNNSPEASPVYSIAPTKNQARLGQPIPAVYGDVVLVPDYAAQPMTEFVANEMYLHALLCLGHGEFDVHGAMIGESNVVNLPADVFTYRIFSPADHRSAFGVIEAATGVPENVVTCGEVGDQELIPNDAGPQWVGPFEMCRPGKVGTEAALDFSLPNGLFIMNPTTGQPSTRIVTIRIEFQQIDPANTPIGAPIVYDHTFTHATNTPQRHTLKWTLPTGRYTCRVHRNYPASGNAQVADRVLWVGLKFRLTAHTGRAYGNVTLAAVKIKASNGIASGSSNEVRFRVTRKLRALGTGALAATRNPVDALIDIVTADYGGRRPAGAAEFDMDAMQAAHGRWAAHNGFNAVFDRTSTVWEAAALSVQTVAAAPLPVGSKISLANDTVKSYRMAMFTDNNIVAGSLAIEYEYARIGDPTAVRIEYRDPLTFSPAYVTTPAGREDTENVTLFGCTDRTVAEQHATLLHNRRRLQRKSIVFETELEGLAVRHGDRIAVSHSLPRWGESLRVYAVRGSVLVLDGIPDWGTAGAAHTVILRDPAGIPHTIAGVVQGANPNEVVLPGAPPFEPVPANADQEATLVAFVADAARVDDWIVTTMSPASDTRIRIGAVRYDPAIYTGAMPHQLIDTFSQNPE